MKKSSIAILVSLSALASIASAQDADNGIQMSKDPARAAQIEEHARNVQAQPSATQFDEGSDAAKAAPQKAKSHHKHASKQTKSHNKHAHKADTAQAAQ
jgi:hypothetical protein